MGSAEEEEPATALAAEFLSLEVEQAEVMALEVVVAVELDWVALSSMRSQEP